MAYIPTIEQAWEILCRYNTEAFHLTHAKIVSGVMGIFAEKYDPERVEFWHVVGMLHDIDFELYPEEHCKKGTQIMRELDLDESIIHAMASHGFGICSDVEPEHIMEKVLFAVDELTGLIGAAVMVRPSKSTKDLEVKSLMKKFKQPSFAAGCSREVIQKGADNLGVELRDLMEETIIAMRRLEDENE